MNANASTSLRTPAPMLWMALICALGLGGTLAFSCGAPFVAVAALAAVGLNRMEGLLTVLVAWLLNQLVGFAILGYPMEGMSLVWSALIGAAMVAGFFAARLSVRLASPSGSAALAFATAFIVFQGAIFAAALVLGGAEAYTFETVGWVLALNGLAYAGLLALHFVLKAFVERSSSLTVPAA